MSYLSLDAKLFHWNDHVCSGTRVKDTGTALPPSMLTLMPLLLVKTVEHLWVGMGQRSQNSL